MPEFTQDECDHCPHCGKVLRDPPNCCEAMDQEHSEEMHRQNPADDMLAGMVNLSDWDNDETDDPAYWEDDDAD